MKTSKSEEDLAMWRRRLTAIGDNLRALSDADLVSNARSRLNGVSHPLSGDTRRRVEAALCGLEQLWEIYLAVVRVIDGAEALVRRNSFLRSTEPELLLLMRGCCVEMPTSTIPWMERDLLHGVDSVERLTLAQAVDRMQVGFAEARATLRQFEHANALVNTRLETLMAQANELDQRAWAVGGIDPLGFSQEALASSLQADPFGSLALLDRMSLSVTRQCVEVSRVEQTRLAVQSAWQAASTRLEGLVQLVNRSRTAMQSCSDNMGTPRGLVEPLDARTLRDLQDWLRTIGHCQEQGRWEAAEIGLARWQAAYELLYAREASAYATNRGPLDEKMALLGKLHAIRAKAGHSPNQSPLRDGRLQKLLDRTQDSLNTQPLDLAQARQLVSACETIVFASRI
jgi:hypothetical protein